MSGIRKGLCLLAAAGAWHAAARAAAAQSCAADGKVESVGLATAGSQGLPAMELEGAPLLQHPFALRASSGPALGLGVLVYSPNEAPFFFPQFGATTYPGAPALVKPFALDAKGASPALLAFPELPQELCGTEVVAQMALLDAAAQGGVAFTKAARLGVGVSKGGAVFPGQRFPTPGTPLDVAIADPDGDALPDLLSVNYFGPLHSLLAGKGDGTFEPPPQVFGSLHVFGRSQTTGDWNGDGQLDVAAVGFGLDGIAVQLGLGGGFFGPEVLLPTGSGDLNAVASGSLGGALGPSLAAADATIDAVWLFHAQPDGTFLPGGVLDVGERPWHVVLADFDGDALLDLATANLDSDDVSLALGLGGGVFAAPLSIPCGADPSRLAAGDVDGDGALDLLVMESGPEQVTAFLGAGGGAFTALPPLVLGFSGTPRLGDVDGDTVLDLVVSGEGRVSVHAGLGDGTFAPGVVFPSGMSPSGLAIGDLDLDGNADLAIADWTGRGLSVVMGQGGGAFAAEQAYALGTPGSGAYSLDDGDFNGDQLADLVVTSKQTDTVVLLRGFGDGTFGAPEPFASGTQTDALAAGDLDGDGALDVALATWSSEGLRVLLGGGDGTFGDPQGQAFGTAADELELADMDGDGVLDVVAVPLPSNAIRVALGAGDGTFPLASPYPAGPAARQAVPCDVNGDGFLDVASSDSEGEGTPLITASYSILLGNGDGTLGAAQKHGLGYTTYSSGGMLAAGDLDADGVADLVMTVGLGSLQSSAHPLLGAGDGTFEPGPAYGLGENAVWVEIADVDADLLRDAVFVHSYSDDVWVLPGLGDGSFGTELVFPVRDIGRCVTLGDWNGDLLPDLAVACAGDDEVSVRLNQVLR